MKKLFFIFLVLIFASSASATVYRWVDERGVVNFADDYDKIPPQYRSKVDEVSMPKMGSAKPYEAPSGAIVGARPGETATQAPPIAQNLVREGDFAIKLVGVLGIGQAKNEAEAESMLTSAGIAPKNGWIADYPVTPDIIGELENAVGEAADAKRLSMAKDEALKALRTAAVEFELPIVAEIPEGDTETPPPTTPEYTEPSVIDNYYYAEGPPVITYYPPPWDYYYMYAWVPTPFWCSGFHFPGFFILHDFHRVFHRHGHPWIITNHFRDFRTGRFYAIDPVRRHAGMTAAGAATTSVRGFNSSEARNGARSIFERNRERGGSRITSMPMTDRGRNSRNPTYPRSGLGNDKQLYNRPSSPSGFNNRNVNNGRPPVNDSRMSRTPGETGLHGMNGRTFSRDDSMNRQNGANVQRPPAGVSRPFNSPSQGTGRSFNPAPQVGTNNRIFRQPNSMGSQNSANVQRSSAGVTRPFSSPSQGAGRSFNPTPNGGNQHFNSSPMGGRGFSGSPQGGNRGSGFGQGGGQHYGSSSGGSGGFSGSHQGGGSGSGFGRGGARF